MSKLYVDEIRPKTSGGHVVMPERPFIRLRVILHQRPQRMGLLKFIQTGMLKTAVALLGIAVLVE